MGLLLNAFFDALTKLLEGLHHRMHTLEEWTVAQRTIGEPLLSLILSVSLERIQVLLRNHLVRLICTSESLAEG